MAKKTRVTPIISDKPDLKMMAEMLKMELAHTDDAPLATEDEVLQGISKASNKPLPTATAQSGRPLKEAAIGRVKLTTMMQKSLVKWLKTYAVEKEMTTADVLETAVNLFKHEKDMNR